jgi:hypothetical protein
MYNNAIFVSRLEDLPKGKYWVIYMQDSYMSPSYNKNDSSYSTYYVAIRAYVKEEDFKAAVEELIMQGKTYKAAVVESLRINFTLNVETNV